MGHDKLRKFAENETFACLVQPSAREIMADGFDHLRDHPLKGHWFQEGGTGLGQDTPIIPATAPIILELGCGKGEYTLELARRNKDKRYIGVDIKGARLWRGAKTATEERLPNVAFLRTRIEFITAFFAPGEISEIWLTFSDPQPKSENNRLSSPLFLERYRSILRPGGIVRLKTDSRFLHEYSKAVAEQNGLTVLACTDDLYGKGRQAVLDSPLASITGRSAVEALFEVRTFYEKMFMAQGYKITYLCFTLDKEAPIQAPEFDEKYWRSVEGPRVFRPILTD